MSTSTAICVGTSPLLFPVSSKSQLQVHVRHSRPNIVQMPPLAYNIRKGELQTVTFQSSSLRVKCAATATATQTQTVTRKARTITVTPDKMKPPKLDDNDGGFPPRDDDGNGGNGGGGGGKFSGGLILLGILGILDIFKDIENEFLRKDRRFDRAYD